MRDYEKRYIIETLETFGTKKAKKGRTINDFFEFLEDNNIKLLTRMNYAKTIRALKGLPEPLINVTRDELKTYFNKLKKDGYKGKSWGKRTTNAYKTNIKRFFQWVHYGDKITKGEDYFKVYPDVVKWIVVDTDANGSSKGAKDVLNNAEIKELMDKSGTRRNRALVFTLYESGTRAFEFVQMKIGDVTFDEMGATIDISEEGKTGHRRLRIFDSIPDLTEWINQHPDKNNPNAPLWITNRGDFMTVRSLHALLKYIQDRTDIKKKVHPHIFRHTRATHLATVFKEPQMREFFGWKKTSNMPATYVHLSGRDIDNTLAEHYGLEVDKLEEEKDEILKPRPCPRKCKEEGKVIIHSPSDKFCRMCGAALTMKAAIKSQEILVKAETFESDGDKILAKLETFESMQKQMEEMQKELAKIKEGS